MTFHCSQDETRLDALTVLRGSTWPGLCPSLQPISHHASLGLRGPGIFLSASKVHRSFLPWSLCICHFLKNTVTPSSHSTKLTSHFSSDTISSRKCSPISQSRILANTVWSYPQSTMLEHRHSFRVIIWLTRICAGLLAPEGQGSICFGSPSTAPDTYEWMNGEMGA